ncbi:MAG: AAA family ATPase [Alphaproteobacteria bacterium]
MKLNNQLDILNKTDSTSYTDEVFGTKKRIPVKHFSKKTELVPKIDNSYVFDEITTLSIIAGFNHNKRVLVQGLHGTGKSTHIEQVAARLNWPCLRINLDGHISRFDLLGKDAIKIEDHKQITTFEQGLLPWSIENPVALVFDEYDAGRPDVMFVIQRLLESDGKLTLLDQNKILTPNPYFRIFATCNTLGAGDSSGLYHGTQNLNQGQLDRWNVFTTLSFMKDEVEVKVIEGKLGKIDKKTKSQIPNMVKLANLIRNSFLLSDISTIMSPRTTIIWAQNIQVFKDIDLAFKLTFLNKCDENDKKIISEFYQRCFGRELGQ